MDNKEKKERIEKPKKQQGHAPNLWVATSTIVVLSVLFIFGKIRDTFGKFTGVSRYTSYLILEDLESEEDDDDFTTKKRTLSSLSTKDKNKEIKPSERTFSRLLDETQTFFTRRVFHRLRDCWDRPICSPAASHIDLIPRYTIDNNKSMVVDDCFVDDISPEEKEKHKEKFSKVKTALNLGSYNYLGFADNWKETCGDKVISSIEEYGMVSTSCILEAGYTKLHKELEEYVARFLQRESALVLSMGYGTNATVLSSILGPGTAVISDSLNHSSIVNGCRGAKGIKILPFKHNDMNDLELTLQRLILCGQAYPKLNSNDSSSGSGFNGEFKPWKKIVVVVEGIYSMEGECVDLVSVNKLCKKYKAYLYLDEAHSIGALGKTGRGICEHAGVDFQDVDILMGTFSKSFAGMGGYVAGNKEVIDKLRASCSGATSMSPLSTTVTKQVLTAFEIIDDPGGLGQKKIHTLHENANYFRKKLKQIGLKVLGDEDSPVIPVMIYSATKIAAISRELLERNVAVVVVGFPATPIKECRVRFCISAGHTKEDLKKAIKEIDTVSKMFSTKYGRNTFG